ncbi:GGDEF domain-containing protein, partial [Pseudoalteromonas sp. S1727]
AIYISYNKTIIKYECLARLINCHVEILNHDSFLYVVNRSRLDGMLSGSMLTECFARFRKSSICWSINITVQYMLDPCLT